MTISGSQVCQKRAAIQAQVMGYGKLVKQKEPIRTHIAGRARVPTGIPGMSTIYTRPAITAVVTMSTVATLLGLRFT